MPLLEAFQHLYLLKEKDEVEEQNKEMERFLMYQMLSNSHPLQTDDVKVKKQREEFVDMITPSFMKASKSKTDANKHKWDEETERKIQAIKAQKEKERIENGERL